jgi:glutathione S-transferase
MLRILGKASSINVRKVLWACDEIGVAYDREDWGSGYRDTGTAEFLKLNPNALVPVVIEDGFSLWESNTIIRYLASAHGAVHLLPTEPRPRALIEQWMDWQATDFNASWRYAFQALVRNNPAFQNAEELRASVEAWSRNVALLDARLATTGGFVTGDSFTLADIPIGLSVNRWFMTPIPDRPVYPSVHAYYELLTTRVPFQRHGCNGLA